MTPETPLTAAPPPPAAGDADWLTGEMDFPDIEMKVVKVRIAGRPYLLRQADERTCAEYENRCMKAMRFREVISGGGAVNIDGLADTEAWLVWRCLTLDDRTNDGAGTPVDIRFVQGLPRQVVKPLYERTKLLSGLADRSAAGRAAAEAGAKKSPPASGTGSD